MQATFFEIGDPFLKTILEIENTDRHLSKRFLQNCWCKATQRAIEKDKTIVFTIWNNTGSTCCCYGSADVDNKGTVTWWASPIDRPAGLWKRKFINGEEVI